MRKPSSVPIDPSEAGNPNPHDPKPPVHEYSLWVFAALTIIAIAISCLAAKVIEPWAEKKAENQPLNAMKNLDTAVRDNDLEAVRLALELNPDTAQGVATRHLHRAIAEGRVEMVELLVDFGADIETLDLGDPVSSLGRVLRGPPLHAAAQSNQPAEIRVRMVRFLVERGADPRKEFDGNLMDIAVRNSDGQLADLLRSFGLDYGAREMAAFNRLSELKDVVKNDPKVLKQRWRSAYLGVPKERWPTLLGIALERGYREMAKFLIQAGAPLDMAEAYGQTPLHKAARGGDAELVCMLVTRGLEVNALDENHLSPLTYSAGRGHVEAAAALIAAGADVNAGRAFHVTALHFAAGSNRTAVVRMLLDAGADPTVRDHNGESVLDWAAWSAAGEPPRTASGPYSNAPKLTPEVAGLLRGASLSKPSGR